MVSGIVVLAASADIDVDTTFENVVVSVVVVVSGRVWLMHQLLTRMLLLRMFEGCMWNQKLLLHQ